MWSDTHGGEGLRGKETKTEVEEKEKECEHVSGVPAQSLCTWTTDRREHISKLIHKVPEQMHVCP